MNKKYLRNSKRNNIRTQHYEGETPKKISGISSGEHKIRIVKSSYRDWFDNIMVESHETKEVSAVLISVSTPKPTQIFHPTALIHAFKLIFFAILVILAVTYYLKMKK